MVAESEAGPGHLPDLQIFREAWLVDLQVASGQNELNMAHSGPEVTVPSVPFVKMSNRRKENS